MPARLPPVRASNGSKKMAAALPLAVDPLPVGDRRAYAALELKLVVPDRKRSDPLF